MRQPDSGSRFNTIAELLFKLSCKRLFISLLDAQVLFEPFAEIVWVSIFFKQFPSNGAFDLQAPTDIAHFTIGISKDNYVCTDMQALFPKCVYMAEERVILLQVRVFSFRIQITEMKSVGFAAFDLDEFDTLLFGPTFCHHHQIFYCLW